MTRDRDSGRQRLPMVEITEDWQQPPGRSDGAFMSYVRRHDEYPQAD